MTPERFFEKCPTLWHVAPAGAWEVIQEKGLRTAEQLILVATLDELTRETLLTQPRPAATRLDVDGVVVMIRDQAPLLRVKDLGKLLGDGLGVADWIHLLNRRTYFFSDENARAKVLNKYIKQDGAQDVLTLSTRQLHTAVGRRLELSAQNGGAVARRSDPYKNRNTYLPLTRFADRKPAEVTVVDGLGVDDLGAVVGVERHEIGGGRVKL